MRVLLVGINPGVRSAETGHHFAGYSNRFWRLLFDSGLVPEAITHVDDRRLPEWGFGITNLVPRATPGMADLTPEEYHAGARVLLGKVRRYRPEMLALVGVTVWRALAAALGERNARTGPLTLGFQRPPATGSAVHRAIPATTRVFVLPNPSGRNANYSYAEMLAAFRTLKRALRSEAPPH